MTASRRRGLLNLARIVVSAGLLAWVVRYAGLDSLLAAARRADWRLYGLAAGLALAGIVVRAARWQALLDAAGARVGRGYLEMTGYAGTLRI